MLPRLQHGVLRVAALHVTGMDYVSGAINRLYMAEPN